MAHQTYRIVTATQSDAEKIVALLHANRDDPSVFVRSIRDVSKNIGDFIVARGSNDQTVGCAALHLHTPSEGEILSVAILPKIQGRGVGSMLTRQCIQIARERNVAHVWLATVKPDYFSRFGFVPFVRWRLPVAVLLYKLRQVLQQPAGRWLPAILGEFAFMELGSNAVA
jgi:N-acetylglutamate synthase-like GNAT family acetyltransferase